MKNSEAIINSSKYQVAAFYSFTPILEKEITSITSEMTRIAKEKRIKGTILVALEGVNGTICGLPEDVALLLKKLKNLVNTEALPIKYSWTKKQAFRRFKARKKKEIVTMGIKEIDPRNVVGSYIEPTKWNEFYKAPDTIIIDTRNKYEIAIGTFKGALNPQTDSFREFPSWVERHLRPLLEEKPETKIGMFCTGGIRCEKATSYLKDQGFDQVFHLHGGILQYLEDVPSEESLWEGECFVFDQRVSLNHELSPGIHRMCHACGMPIAPEDVKKDSYIKGIQCHNCVGKFSDLDRARFAERQRQIDDLMKRLPDNSIWPNS